MSEDQEHLRLINSRPASLKREPRGKSSGGVKTFPALLFRRVGRAGGAGGSRFQRGKLDAFAGGGGKRQPVASQGLRGFALGDDLDAAAGPRVLQHAGTPLLAQDGHVPDDAAGEWLHSPEMRRMPATCENLRPDPRARPGKAGGSLRGSASTSRRWCSERCCCFRACGTRCKECRSVETSPRRVSRGSRRDRTRRARRQGRRRTWNSCSSTGRGWSP